LIEVDVWVLGVAVDLPMNFRAAVLDKIRSIKQGSSQER
jgi:hypothetical protein